MYINVLNIEEKKKNIEKIKDNYNDIYVNYYNTIKNISNNWAGQNSNLFQENINKEKLQLNNTITNIEDLINIYNYIKEKYSLFGNEIKYNFENKEKNIDKINALITKVDIIYREYNNINKFEQSNINNILLEERKKIINIKEKLLNIKTKTLNIIKEINEIEKKVKLNISKQNIEIVNETNISNLI